MKEEIAREIREQGDVLLYRIDSIPDGLDTASREYVLAHGEHTGHAHRLVDEAENADEMARIHGAPEKKEDSRNFIIMRDPKSNVTYLRVFKETQLVHNEHDKVPVPPGDYRIGQVREKGMFDEMIRPVLD